MLQSFTWLACLQASIYIFAKCCLVIRVIIDSKLDVEQQFKNWQDLVTGDLRLTVKPCTNLALRVF